MQQRAGSSWAIKGVLIALLVMQAAWLGALAGRDRVTYDEPCYIGAGDVYLRHGDLTWNPEHPPLMKLLVGLSVRAVGARPPDALYTPGVSQCYAYGDAMLYESGNDTGRVLWAARVPAMVLALVMTGVVFVFARDLFGSRVALLPAALVVVYPPVLAHGHYATDDLAAALWIVTACWCAWRARHRDVRWLAGVALAVGLGIASKFTVLSFVPVAAVLSWYATGVSTRSAWRRSALTAGVVVGALVVVWMSYLVVARPPVFAGPTPASAQHATGVLAGVADRLPLPAPARVGIRYELGLPDDARANALFGHSYLRGRPAYFPVLFAATTPLALLAAWGVAVLVAIRRRANGVLVFAVVPATWILVVATLGSVNLGVRTVLAAPVLLIVAAGAIIEGLAPRRAVAVGGLTAGLTAMSVVAAMPFALSYANELAGGPDHLYEVVADGDWGQDYAAIGAWLERGPAEPVVGLHLETTLTAEQLGFGVPKVTTAELAGLGDGLVVTSSVLYDLNRDAYAPFGEPVDQLAPSLLVFRVGPGTR